MSNILDNIPDQLPQEMVNVLVDTSRLSVERIVSRGHVSPDSGWYDQSRHEWVMVLQGAARVEIREGEILHLNVGDYIILPAHTEHRVIWTDPERDTIWLAIHYDD